METKMIIEEYIQEKANKWLNGNYDPATKSQIKKLLESEPNELIDSFYADLEFGTGGLRGIMGVGTNRMNIYTVSMATQGLCNYLKSVFPEEKIKVAIAHDSRNNSPLFAKTAAEVFSANGIFVYLFSALRPTPELSFAVRHLQCKSGIVITASHNPKEYNGYKAYWEDGAQLIPPHDENVIAEVRKITDIDEVKRTRVEENIQLIDKEIDKIYLEKIRTVSFSKYTQAKPSNLKIVYTSLHGTGITLVPQILKDFGFKDVTIVEEQAIADGNFPTVKSPNPEEAEALTLALKKAEEIDADIVLATDPDADRVGIAVKNADNNFVLLNGNQTGSVLIAYLLYQWTKNNKLHGKEFIAKTIVTTDLIEDICKKYQVECFSVLTGFKYIAELIRELEGTKKFIGGGEESYGYLMDDFVRDKDAIMSAVMIAEAAAWAKDQGSTFHNQLLELYMEFGYYKEGLISITKKGKSGAEEITAMMDTFRKHPPKSINDSQVIAVLDYEFQKSKDMLTGLVSHIDLPKSNVLQFVLKDGSKITARPSGTEPKIKFYFGVKAELTSKEAFAETDALLNDKIKHIIESMKLQ
jgi:phosphoglucomutase